MQKKHKQLSLFSLAMVLMVVGASSAFALPSQASAHAQSVGTTGSSQASSHQPAQAAEAKANAQTRLAAAQLKSCQNRQQAIDNIMARISDRGQKQMTLFSTIAARAEKFYTAKGNILNNYDTLLVSVNTQQTAAQTAVDAIKADSTGFSCDSSNPKAFVASFKDSLKSEISALQAYRTSVKNLIVGVKSVQKNVSTDQTNGGSQ